MARWTDAVRQMRISPRFRPIVALVIALALMWAVPIPVLYVGIAVVLLFLAAIWDAWYLALTGLFAAGMAAVGLIVNPYDESASESTLWLLKLAITLSCLAWALVTTFAGAKAREVKVRILWPSRRLLTWARAVLVGAAAVADLFRYQSGIPLFSSTIDVSREELRQTGNIVTGLLHEGWTVALMLTVAVFIAHRGFKAPTEYIWLIVCVLGAFGGASRNALLIAVVPAVLFAIALYNPHTTLTSGRKPTHRVWRIGVFASGAAALIAGGLLMLFSATRVLKGTGGYERAFQALYDGNPFGAMLGSLDLTLSSSFETFARLYNASPEGFGPLQLTTLQFLGSVVRAFGFHPDLYVITSGLSAPYYMNTATYLAAPLVDFGWPGAVVFAVLFGVGAGAIDVLLRRKSDVSLQLVRYYFIYIFLFAVYEFTPFISPSWVAVLASLLLLAFLARRERKVDEPTATTGSRAL